MVALVVVEFDLAAAAKQIIAIAMLVEKGISVAQVATVAQASGVAAVVVE